MRDSIIPTALLTAAVLCSPVAAQAPLRFADLGTCPTLAGEVVRDCRVAYRTYGRLSPARDNAVLVPTWYGGRSETMTFLLGPDGWLDTTRYFAILMDNPGNGVSISPSNSASQPGRRFPRLTLEDMVAAEHRAVTEHLGIRRLHAVIGWSMGGMQATGWALRHPEAVDRIVSVAGTPRMGTYEMYWVRSSLTLLDLAQAAGTPADTLAVNLAELWHLVASSPAQENRLPRDSVDQAMAAEARADWVGLHPEDNRLELEAVTAWDAIAAVRRAPARTRARMLFLFVPEDHTTTPASFREFAALTGADTVAFASACGHVAPICQTSEIGREVRRYLDAREVRAAR